MRYSVSSDGKINLTLRLTRKLENGYHSLVSLFGRLPAIETLTISTSKEDNVRELELRSNMKINGENSVEKTMRFLRNDGWLLPHLNIYLSKRIPPGTGLGAGSGNAASFARWARFFEGKPVSPHILEKVGADVPFLYSDSSLALVQGVGEKYTYKASFPPFKILVATPEWRVSTPWAYAEVDKFYKIAEGGNFPLDEEKSLDEAEKYYEALSRGENVGLLPNDFYPWLFGMHSEYEEFFNACKQSGAIAYGLSGSGSSVFALFNSEDACVKLSDFEKMQWIQQILFWSDDR